MTQLRPLSMFKQSNFLSKAGLLAVGIAVTGCNSNSTEAKQSSASSSSALSDTASKATPAADSDADVVTALEKNFQASGFEQKIISAVPTKMDGIYWVTGEGIPSFFSDKSGRFLIQGQIIEIGQEKPIDISTDLMASNAKDVLAKVNKDELIVFPAKGETKAAVYVFTDVDCPYCTKLHEEIDEINGLGIEVRYLAWPRSEQSVPKMQAIWCSEDRVAAMNQAKSGMPLAAASCNDPVRAHMQLGASLGVSGTPAIYTESGHQIGGYLPAQQLAQAAIAN